MFDWIAFLDRYNIEYVTGGKSTAKGNVYTKCPFCGAEDRGHHMGISTEGRGWGCWKYDDHRGKSPIRLVKALAHLSHMDALAIVGSGREVVASGTLVNRLEALLNGAAKDTKSVVHPVMPDTFKPLPAAHLYMRERNFGQEEVEWLTEAFDLRWCRFRPDDWAYRIIVPVYDERAELVTWTGRSTAAKARLRYKTLSTKEPDKSGAIATAPIPDCFLRPYLLKHGARSLVLVEGPFDCFRLALEEQDYNTLVTPLFGKLVSAAQIDFLARCRNKYDRVFLTLDSGEVASSLKLSSRLAALDVETVFLSGKKDPGDFTRKEARQFLNGLRYR